MGFRQMVKSGQISNMSDATAFLYGQAAKEGYTIDQSNRAMVWAEGFFKRNPHMVNSSPAKKMETETTQKTTKKKVAKKK